VRDKQPIVWKRFIDDVFLIWTHGAESLQEFLEYLNSCVDSIKFTMESSETSVSFLDTRVKIVENRIQTDLYSKPTDSHSYLLYDSAHPQRCKDSIPYSQFLRVRRICSMEEDCRDHILTLTCHFMGRGYPMKLLEEAATEVHRLDRALLLRKAGDKARDKEDRVFLITTYNPNFQHLRKIVKNNWDFLGKSPTTDFLYERRLMCGYRRPKNLRDQLVRANIPFLEGDELVRQEFDRPGQVEQAGEEEGVAEAAPLRPVALAGPPRQRSILDYISPIQRVIILPDNQPTSQTASNVVASTSRGDVNRAKNILTPKKRRGFNFCNQKVCRYCPKLDKTGQVISTVTGKVHTSKTHISCRSSNLIYCITCRKCKKQYVGQTSLKLKSRFVHHFYTVDRPDTSKPVGKHFSQLDHDGIADMIIHVLEFISLPPTSIAAATVRNRMERR
jgi:hypothetical protein